MKTIAPKLSEKAFQRQVMQLADICGWIIYHTFDSRRSRRGFPDLVLVHPKLRRTIFAELKTDTGRVSIDQQLWIDALTAAGQTACVWRPMYWPSIEKDLRLEAGA